MLMDDGKENPLTVQHMHHNNKDAVRISLIYYLLYTNYRIPTNKLMVGMQ